MKVSHSLQILSDEIQNSPNVLIENIWRQAHENLATPYLALLEVKKSKNFKILHEW